MLKTSVLKCQSENPPLGVPAPEVLRRETLKFLPPRPATTSILGKDEVAPSENHPIFAGAMTD